MRFLLCLAFLLGFCSVSGAYTFKRSYEQLRQRLVNDSLLDGFNRIATGTTGSLVGYWPLSSTTMSGSNFLNIRYGAASGVVSTTLGGLSTTDSNPTHKFYSDCFRLSGTKSGTPPLQISSSNHGLTNTRAFTFAFMYSCPDTINMTATRGVFQFGTTKGEGVHMWWKDTLGEQCLFFSIGTSSGAYLEYKIKKEHLSMFLTHDYTFPVVVVFNSEMGAGENRVRFYINGYSVVEFPKFFRVTSNSTYPASLSSIGGTANLFFGIALNGAYFSPKYSCYQNIITILKTINPVEVIVLSNLLKNTYNINGAGQSNDMVACGGPGEGIGIGVRGTTQIRQLDLSKQFSMHVPNYRMQNDSLREYTWVGSKSRYPSFMSSIMARSKAENPLYSCGRDVAVFNGSQGGCGLHSGTAGTPEFIYTIEPSHVDIEKNTMYVPRHNLFTGHVINFGSSCGSLGTGMATIDTTDDRLTDLFVIVKSYDTIMFANTYEDAMNRDSIDITEAPTEAVTLVANEYWLNNKQIYTIPTNPAKVFQVSTPLARRYVCTNRTKDVSEIREIRYSADSTKIVTEWVKRCGHDIQYSHVGNVEDIYMIYNASYSSDSITLPFNVVPDGTGGYVTARIDWTDLQHHVAGYLLINHLAALSYLHSDSLDFFNFAFQTDGYFDMRNNMIYNSLDSLVSRFDRYLGYRPHLLLIDHDLPSQTRSALATHVTRERCIENLHRWAKERSSIASIATSTVFAHVVNEADITWTTSILNINAGVYFRKVGRTGSAWFKSFSHSYNDYKNRYNILIDSVMKPTDQFETFWDYACTEQLPGTYTIQGYGKISAVHTRQRDYDSTGLALYDYWRYKMGETVTVTRPKIEVFSASLSTTKKYKVTTASGKFTTKYEQAGKGFYQWFEQYNPAIGNWEYGVSGVKNGADSTLTITYPNPGTISRYAIPFNYNPPNEGSLPSDPTQILFKEKSAQTGYYVYDFKHDSMAVFDSINTRLFAPQSGYLPVLTPCIDSIRPVWQKRGLTFKVRGRGFQPLQGSGCLFLGSSNLLGAFYWSDTLIVDTIPGSWSPRGIYDLRVVSSLGLRDTTQLRVLIPSITAGTP